MARLYKNPNKENDWSNVSEVTLKADIGAPYIGAPYKVFYHGRTNCLPHRIIVECPLTGMIMSVAREHVFFSRGQRG